MRTYRDKPCQRCGKDFPPDGPRSLYCDACKGTTGNKGSCPSRFTDSAGNTLHCTVSEEHSEHADGVWFWSSEEEDQ